MTKRTHQVFFAGIIINLIALLFLIPEFTSEFYLTLASFACMIILPFGKKGGVYHIILSTAGILIYITFFIFILLPL